MKKTTDSELFSRLKNKLGRDRIFMLASALAFDAMVAIVPLLLLTIWALGLAMDSSTAAREAILGFVERAVPLASGRAKEVLFSLVEEREWIGVIGSVGLVWAATRLFGSIRGTLEIVFEIPPDRRMGWWAGKGHDAQMVGVVGGLLLATVALTSALHWIQAFGIRVLGLGVDDLDWAVVLIGGALAFALTWSAFFVAYRWVPDRAIPAFDAAVAATFAGILFEIAKRGFVVYLSEFGRIMQAYGSFSSLVAIALWAWYSSLVFVVGGELASARTLAADPDSGVRDRTAEPADPL